MPLSCRFYAILFPSPLSFILPNGAWCMPQDLFPDPGPDDAEPDGFPLDQDAPGPEQGLYITLPPEQLTLAGFCQGGASDTMAPARCWPLSWTRWPGRTARAWRAALVS